MKITVITVVYNDVSNIKATIDSVLSQTYDDIEYIIVDGNSDDGTLGVINNYSGIRILSESDEGIFDAMNKGINLATGDYINFLNSGDSYTSPTIMAELVTEMLEFGDPDFVYGSSIEVDNVLCRKYHKVARSIKWIYYGMPAHHQAMLYKMSVITQRKIKYDIKYPTAGDYAFTINFISHCGQIMKTNLNICFYSLDGISQTVYLKDLSEVKSIKHQELKMSWLFIHAISIVNKLFNQCKLHFPKLYVSIRYPFKKRTHDKF